MVGSPWATVLVAGLLCVGLVPLGVLAAWSSDLVVERARDDARLDVASAAYSAATGLSEQLGSLADLVDSYARRQTLRDALASESGAATVDEALRELTMIREEISHAAATDDRGRLVSVFPESPTLLGESFAYRDWYTGAVTTRRAYVSEVFEPRVANARRVISVSAPVLDPHDDNDLVGVIEAAYDAASIEGLVAQYETVPGVAIAVVDQGGAVVAHTGDAAGWLESISEQASLAQLLRTAATGGVHTAVEPDGVYGFAPVGRSKWIVVGRLDARDAFAGAEVLTANIKVAAGVVIVVVAGGLLLHVRFERRRRAASVELRRTTALLRTVIDATPHALIVLDDQLRPVLTNLAAESLWGPIDVDRTHRPTSPDPVDSAFLVEALRALDEGVTVRSEARAVTAADGARVLLSTIVTPIGVGGAEKFVLGVCRDVTSSVEIEESVRRAHREADEANRAKSAFLSRMSHELRTPLNAVIGFAQLLEQDDLDATQRDNARQIRLGGQHLLELINEVLDISLIETDRLKVVLEPVPLRSVIDDSLGLVAALAKSRSIVVSLDDRTGPRTAVTGDRRRLAQVLLNFLTNAIKYNHEHGSIIVSCRVVEPTRVRIAVTDTGPGIPSEAIDLVFAPFERLGAEQSGIHGTGLGLALSRGLVMAMGGDIGVSSAPGHGATFWVDLPRAGPVPLDGSVAPIRPEVTRAGDPDREMHTVLYIEDNGSNIRLVERVIEPMDHYTLVVARDGATGLAVARERQPDVILLDLNLPDMAGRDVLGELTSTAGTAHIPVVVVSADATAAQASALVDAGAVAYLTKPFDVGRLRRLVQAQVASVVRVPAPECTVCDGCDGAACAPAEQAGSDGAPVTSRLDSSIVDALRELLPTEMDARDFMATFDEECDRHLADLAAAMQSGDQEGIRQHAHALSGGLATIGATEAVKLCRTIENDPAWSVAGHERVGSALRHEVDLARARLRLELVDLA